MARIFIDGFESGAYDLWDVRSGVDIVSSAGKDMDGNYCMDASSTSDYLSKDITADEEMYFAFLYRPADSANSKSILSLWKDTTLMIQIRRNNSSQFMEVYVGGVLAVTGTIQLLVNTTCLIEIRCLIHDVTGRLVTKVDGVTDIDFTGDTKTGADTQFNKVRLGHISSTKWCFAYYDNFIMDDSDWIGRTCIQAVVPTGAGNATEWTPSAGSNYECVDEVPYSDVDYVSTNVVDKVDTYAAGNMTGDIESVKCVQVQARANYDGSPTPTNLKLAVRSGGTDYLSGDKAVPPTAKSFSHLWETNPADSLAWEEADVNAMEIGVKSAA